METKGGREKDVSKVKGRKRMEDHAGGIPEIGMEGWRKKGKEVERKGGSSELQQKV